jgi:WD40 repeat protein
MYRPGFSRILLAVVVVSACKGRFLPAQTETPLEVRRITFSPDGKLIVVATGHPDTRGEVNLWDVESRKLHWTHREVSGVGGAAFAPSGAMLAIGTYDHSARLLDTATAKVLKSLPGHADTVRVVEFTRDGKELVTGCWDGTIKFWDLASGTVRKSFEVESRKRVYSLALSPDGKWFVPGGSMPESHFWEVATGVRQHSLTHDGQDVGSVMFTPDGQGLFTTGNDGRVRLWDVRSGHVLLELKDLPHPNCFAYCGVRQFLALRGPMRATDVALYDLHVDDVKDAERKRVRALIADLDADLLDVRDAASDKLREIGRPAQAELVRALGKTASPELVHRARELLDLWRPTPEVLPGHTSEIYSFSFTPDGKLLASGDKVGDVKLWDLATRKEIATLNPSDRARK